MPQFDNVTFFNQIFWFSILLFAFYFFVLKNVLPKLGMILKARKKKVYLGPNSAISLQKKQLFIIKSMNKHMEDKCILYRKELDLLNKEVVFWNVTKDLIFSEKLANYKNFVKANLNIVKN